MLRIARLTVVRADVNAPAGDDGGGVSLRTQPGNPLDVPAVLGSNESGKPFSAETMLRDQAWPIAADRWQCKKTSNRQ